MLSRRQLVALRRASGAAARASGGTPDVAAVPVARLPPSREHPEFMVSMHPARDALGFEVMRDPSVSVARTGTVQSPGYRQPAGCAAWPSRTVTAFPATDDDLAWSARGCAREVANTLYAYGHWRGYGAYGGGTLCGAFDLNTFGNFRNAAANDITALQGHAADGVSETTPTAMAAKPGNVYPVGSTLNRGRFSFYRAAAIANAKRWSRVFAEELVRQCDAYFPDGGGGPVALCYPYHLALDIEEGPNIGCFHDVANSGGWVRLADMRNHVGDPRYSGEVVWRDAEGVGRTVKDWWDARVASGAGGGAWAGGLPLPVDKGFNDSTLAPLGYELQAFLKGIMQYSFEEALVSVLRERVPGMAWSMYGFWAHRDDETLTAAQMGWEWVRGMRADLQGFEFYTYEDPAPAAAPVVTMQERMNSVDVQLARQDVSRPGVAYVMTPHAGSSTRAGWGGRDVAVAVLKKLWSAGVYRYFIWGEAGTYTDPNTGLSSTADLRTLWDAVLEFRGWVADQLAGSRSRVRVPRGYRGRGRVDEDVAYAARVARRRRR